MARAVETSYGLQHETCSLRSQGAGCISSASCCLHRYTENYEVETYGVVLKQGFLVES